MMHLLARIPSSLASHGTTSAALVCASVGFVALCRSLQETKVTRDKGAELNRKSHAFGFLHIE